MTDRDLFIAALEHADPAERAAWLDRACAGDTDRRRRVDVLLRAHDQASRFLANPAGPPAVLRRVADDPVRPPREANPDVPDWLDAIVRKLLAKNPADRFPTAGEV